jgi:hypothetical protein
MSFQDLGDNDILWMRILKDGKETLHGPFINTKICLWSCKAAIRASGLFNGPQAERTCNKVELETPSFNTMTFTSNICENASILTVAETNKEVASRLHTAHTFSVNVFVVLMPTVEVVGGAETDKLANHLCSGTSMSSIDRKPEAFINADKAYARALEFSTSYASQHGFSDVQLEKRGDEEHGNWTYTGFGEYGIKESIGDISLIAKGRKVDCFASVCRVKCKVEDARDFVPGAS